MLDVVNVAAANWPQTVTNPATPRAVPPPVAAPQAVSSENPQVAQAQRAIAWTGHLEWQDTVSTVLSLMSCEATQLLC